MKRKTFFFLLGLLLLVPLSLHAYDFQSGDLYYNITNDTIVPYEVEVTSQIMDWSWSGSSNYSHLTETIIPETVIYDGETYSVTSIGVVLSTNVLVLRLSLFLRV